MHRTNGSTRAAITRGTVYFALWVLLTGFDALDLVVGAFAAAAATWASLRLIVPGTLKVRLAPLPGLTLRLMLKSATAGIDVARRAFAPRLPLHPGFVSYPTGYPRGPARNAFASLSSLLPGSVSVRDDEQGLLYHCLDVEQPVVSGLATDEAAISRVLLGSGRA